MISDSRLVVAAVLAASGKWHYLTTAATDNAVFKFSCSAILSRTSTRALFTLANGSFSSRADLPRAGADQRRILLYLLEEDIAKDVESLKELGIGNVVVHGVPVFAGAKNVALPHHCQVLGKVGRRQLQPLR